jgi:hypothetical protein
MSSVLTPEEEQLQNEQVRGNAAKHSYDQFIKGFVEDKRQILFETWRSLPITAELELAEVKRMLYAIDTLETEIKTIIDTGMLASTTLNKEVKH